VVRRAKRIINPRVGLIFDSRCFLTVLIGLHRSSTGKRRRGFNDMYADDDQEAQLAKRKSVN
jgi:hypothetical protein